MNAEALLHALEALCDAAVRAGVSGAAVDHASELILASRRPRAAPQANFPQQAGPTWAKLKDGSWGIRTKGRDGFVEGQMVTVTSKAGKAQRKCLGVCVASGADWALWEAQDERAAENDHLRYREEEAEEVPF